LLETKLYVPRSRRGLVPRPWLNEQLDRGTLSRLTLVSAPAGFGKTTPLTEWLAAGRAAPAGARLVAWLSLDPADNDPASFWPYVIAALRAVAPGVGESALTLLPPALYVVIASRADPALPLPRWRAANWSRSARPSCGSPLMRRRCT
jgi:LuxR family maltose regulon positive regulatory protein